MEIKRRDLKQSKRETEGECKTVLSADYILFYFLTSDINLPSFSLSFPHNTESLCCPSTAK